MVASAAATWAIVIVVVLCLVTWLSAVALAARRPYWKKSTKRPMIGPVVGAIHYADGGRSVAPDREAPPVFTDEEMGEMRRKATGVSADRVHVPGQPVPGQRTPGQPVPGQPVPGQPVPGQRVASGAGSGAQRQPVSGQRTPSSGGSGAEREPADRPRLPGQRAADRDQAEHPRRRQ